MHVDSGPYMSHFHQLIIVMRSLWPTARYKHKEFLIQRLYLGRNLARSSHWRSLVLKTHSKERRGEGVTGIGRCWSGKKNEKSW